MYRASIFRSVQRGTITLNNATSGTATLSTALVSIDYAFITFLGYGAAGTEPNSKKFVPKLVLTNTTTVTATLNTVLAVNNVIPFEVKEYWPNELLQAVQRGTIDTSASLTATITGVGSKAFVQHCGTTDALDNTVAGFSSTPYWPAVVLTNATTLTATRLNALDYILSYEVIDPR